MTTLTFESLFPSGAQEMRLRNLSSAFNAATNDALASLREIQFSSNLFGEKANPAKVRGIISEAFHKVGQAASGILNNLQTAPSLKRRYYGPLAVNSFLSEFPEDVDEAIEKLEMLQHQVRCVLAAEIRK